MRLFINLLLTFSFIGSQALANSEFQEEKCLPITTVLCSDYSKKYIDGFEVTKCWQTEQRHKCISKEINNCQPIEENRGCHEDKVSCAEETEFGLCAKLTKKFKCGANSGLTETIRPFSSIFDFKDKICIPNTVINECKPYENLCKVQSKECLHKDGDNCDHYEFTYQCGESESSKIDCFATKFCVGGICDAEPRKKYNNFGKAVSHLSILEHMKGDEMQGCKCPDGREECLPEEIDPNTCRFFDGQAKQCRKYTGEYNCCTNKGIVTGAVKCEQDEKDLIAKRKKGLCHQVGSWQGKGSQGFKNKEYYCCFNSKLTKIIQVAGRQQLGIGWGSKRNPDCRGLTLNEIQKIDFGNVDFSELFNEMEQKAQTMVNSKQREIMDKMANIKEDSKNSTALINQKIQEFYKRGNANE